MAILQPLKNQHEEVITAGESRLITGDSGGLAFQGISGAPTVRISYQPNLAGLDDADGSIVTSPIASSVGPEDEPVTLNGAVLPNLFTVGGTGSVAVKLVLLG